MTHPGVRLHSTLKESTILLVEDDRDVRILLGSLLAKMSNHVEVAPNGVRALERLAAEDFDFVICDLQMPAVSGVEVCRFARRNPRTIVLAISGYLNSENARLLDHLGVAFLAKPFRTTQLVDSLERLISASRNPDPKAL